MKAKNPFTLHGHTPAKKEEDRVVVGGYIPRQLAEKIAATALYLAVPRSKLIEMALTTYLDNVHKTDTEIINTALQRIYAGWESHKLESQGKYNWNSVVEFIKYKKQVLKSLTKRGVSHDFLVYIKNKVEIWND